MGRHSVFRRLPNRPTGIFNINKQSGQSVIDSIIKITLRLGFRSQILTWDKILGLALSLNVGLKL